MNMCNMLTSSLLAAASFDALEALLYILGLAFVIWIAHLASDLMHEWQCRSIRKERKRREAENAGRSNAGENADRKD
jgi:hypothetical protein